MNIEKITKYDMALVGLRLLAIYVVLQLLVYLPFLISTWITNSPSFSLKTEGVYIFSPVVFLLIPILLWIFSERIARFVTQSTSRSSSTTDSNDLEPMLFRVVGIYILMTTVPNFAGWIYQVIHAERVNMPFSYFTQSFVIFLFKIALSLLLIFTAKTLSIFLHKFRFAGFKK